jgi:hypothetical protein
MKCWNSAFNAQGLRVIIVVVHIGAVENICSSSRRVGAQGNRKDRMETQFTTKIWFGGRTSLVGSQFFHFVTFSFLVMRLMPYYYAGTGRSKPPKLHEFLIFLNPMQSCTLRTSAPLGYLKVIHLYSLYSNKL